QLSLGKAKKGSHGPGSGWHRLLHVPSALAHQADRIGEAQRARCDQCRIFSEAVACHVIRMNALRREHRQGGRRDGKQRGLLVFRELKLIFGTLEAEPGEREIEGFIGLLEYGRRFGERFGKGSAHPCKLGTLAWKEEGCLGQLSSYYLRRARRCPGLFQQAKTVIVEL